MLSTCPCPYYDLFLHLGKDVNTHGILFCDTFQRSIKWYSIQLFATPDYIPSPSLSHGDDYHDELSS